MDPKLYGSHALSELTKENCGHDAGHCDIRVHAVNVLESRPRFLGPSGPSWLVLRRPVPRRLRCCSTTSGRSRHGSSGSSQHRCPYQVSWKLSPTWMLHQSRYSSRKDPSRIVYSVQARASRTPSGICSTGQHKVFCWFCLPVCFGTSGSSSSPP